MAWSAGCRSCSRPAPSRSRASPWSPWPASRDGSASSTPRRPAACSTARVGRSPSPSGTRCSSISWGPRPFRGGGGAFRIIPLADVLDGAFRPEWVQDKIVLVGFTTAGIDDHPTPTTGDRRMWGVEILGNAIETLLHQRFLVPAPRPIIVGLILGLALLAALFAAGRRPLAMGVLVLVVLGLYLVAASTLLETGLILDLVLPPSALLLTFAVGLVDRVVFEQAEQRRIREAMGRYLSPSVSRWVLADPRRLRLGGELRELTVLFSDLRSFTTHAHALPPETLVGAPERPHERDDRHRVPARRCPRPLRRGRTGGVLERPHLAARSCPSRVRDRAGDGRRGPSAAARVRGPRVGRARHGSRRQHREHDRGKPRVPGPPGLHGGRRPGERRVPARGAQQGVRRPCRDRRGHAAGRRRRLRVPLPGPGRRQGAGRAGAGLRAPRAGRRHPSRAAGAPRAIRPRRDSLPGAAVAGSEGAIRGARRGGAGRWPCRAVPPPGPGAHRRAPRERLGRRVDRRRRSSDYRRDAASSSRGESSTNPGAGPRAGRMGEMFP